MLVGFYLGEIKHNCATDNSEVWGCKHDAEIAKWAIPCMACHATGRNNDGGICTVCDGQKQIPQLRCPTSTLGGDIVSTNLLFKSFKALEDYQILPNAGGYLEQSAYFVNGIEHIKMYISLWNKLSEAKKEKLASLKRG